MPKRESFRSTAEAIGRISCIQTGEEIGLLYQWDNGETQAALYVDGSSKPPSFRNQVTEPNLGAKRG
ncbi:hypothetical protein ACGYJ8_04705 [Sulfitobacter sp. 1A12126]|uniref:hypothetical protein n=1 Tax=Roseobacteraceae TaxID=2854170 RepID=UPI001F2D9DEE|nr:hypothetical protein [Ruegeria pomeroyi]MCE8508483.1 hypothetical protein [Ruegeria pomeroyi]